MRTGAVPIIVNSYEFIFSAEFDDPFFDRKNSAGILDSVRFLD
jgi:hypothetical protein